MRLWIVNHRTAIAIAWIILVTTLTLVLQVRESTDLL
jgi:hypothetical protein